MEAQRSVQGHVGLMIWEGNEGLENVDHCISKCPILHLHILLPDLYEPSLAFSTRKT